MSRAVAFRGQPLLLLGGVLAGWVCLRLVMWQSSWPEPLQAAPLDAVASLPRVVAGQTGRISATSQDRIQVPHISSAPGLAGPRLREPSWDPLVSVEALGPHAVATGIRPAVPPAPSVPSAAPLLAVAGPVGRPNGLGRWSADGWLLLRGDNAAPVLTGSPSYGRSQVGAALRYDLAPESGRQPRAYLRVNAAIAGARERQLAAGLSFRPLPEIPLRIAAEARVTETDFGTSLDGAVLAVSELPAVELPLGMRGEAYVQGGYVTGSYATAFVDGQARVERPLSQIGAAELSIGGGAWGGAQAGAARLDIGPSAMARFPLGKAYGRLAVDYRFRIAGDAAPANGPALTLSAGF